MEEHQSIARLKASPTFVPTHWVTLAPVAPDETITPPQLLPTGTPQTSVDPCGINAYVWGYTCKIAKAEKLAGFDAKEFPADPKGFIFKDVFTAKADEIMLEYDVIGGGGYLLLDQGISGDFPTFKGGVPDSAIQEVQVGQDQGEYVEGDYFTGGENNTYVWNSCCRARLRWMESNHWFELDKEAALPEVDFMTRDVMIQMAESLVYQPGPNQGLNADYLPSPEEATQLAGFEIEMPTVLPEGFIFKYASYNQDLSQLRLHYEPDGDAGVAAVLIVETPIEKVSLAPGDNGEDIQGEGIDINGSSGTYFSDSPYNHVVTWQNGNLKITLSIYSSETGYGGGFTRDQILAIVRSMK